MNSLNSKNPSVFPSSSSRPNPFSSAVKKPVTRNGIYIIDNLPPSQPPNTKLPPALAKLKTFVIDTTKAPSPVPLAVKASSSNKRELPWARKSGPSLQAKKLKSVSSVENIDDGPALSKEQLEILEWIVNQGQSVFFTGSAGTGKSFLLRRIIQQLHERHSFEAVAVTAPTGIAACNISGCTLHSFAGIGIGEGDGELLLKKARKNPKAIKRWQECAVLIIDEISMVDAKFLDNLEWIARQIRGSNRPFGGIQLVISGDFFQLPPVAKSNGYKFAFEAMCWSQCIQKTAVLTHVYRQQDLEFVRMLNELRLGEFSPTTMAIFRSLSREPNYPQDGILPTRLFSLRHQVDSSNSTQLALLPGVIHIYKARDSGKNKIYVDRLPQSTLAPCLLQLKLNAQVILLKNLDQSLVNGTRGIVVSFETSGDGEKNSSLGLANQEWPRVRFENGREMLITPESWEVDIPGEGEVAKRVQVPLLLAWAMSIHKSQGQTLERVVVDLGKVFEKGQAYVALSRATALAGLQVLNFDPKKVQAHPKVVAHYKSLLP